MSNTDVKLKKQNSMNPVFAFFKRTFDILISLIFLIVLSPLFLILAIVIKRDGGSAFYTQRRIGKNGKVINVYKFRSMRPNADRLEDFLTPDELEQYRKDYKLEHDPRITKVGHVLRKTSLDELPQLLCILKGDMSLIGPRPVLDDELKGNYSDEQIERLLSVRPGLTGYWQAYSRNESSYLDGDRQRQELYYIDHVSLWLDIKIIFKTIGRVVSGKGAN